jgi:hypothetical protein
MVARGSASHADHTGDPYRHGSTQAFASHNCPCVAQAAGSQAGSDFGSAHAATTTSTSKRRTLRRYSIFVGDCVPS